MEQQHILERLVAEDITKVNAGYRYFDLKIKRTLTHNGTKCFGLTDWDKGEITLVSTQEHVDSRETLLHELLHVVLDLVGLGGHETTGIVTRRTNEEMVTLISRGLLLLMNLNPKLFEILNEQQPPQPEHETIQIDSVPLQV